MSSLSESDNLDTVEINSFHAAKCCRCWLLLVVVVVVAGCCRCWLMLLLLSMLRLKLAPKLNCPFFPFLYVRRMQLILPIMRLRVRCGRKARRSLGRSLRTRRRKVQLGEAAVGKYFNSDVLSLAVITTVFQIKLHERECRLYVNMIIFQHQLRGASMRRYS